MLLLTQASSLKTQPGLTGNSQNLTRTACLRPAQTLLPIITWRWMKANNLCVDPWLPYSRIELVYHHRPGSFAFQLGFMAHGTDVSVGGGSAHCICGRQTEHTEGGGLDRRRQVHSANAAQIGTRGWAMESEEADAGWRGMKREDQRGRVECLARLRVWATAVQPARC
jgi:hypothetical protein